jgi:hypothetical protein
MVTSRILGAALTAAQWERVNELVQPRRRPAPDGA